MDNYDQIESLMVYELERSIVDDEINHKIALEQNESIHDLEQDMVHLSEMCANLSSMVGEQGETLDIPKNQIEQTLVDTEEGVKHLEKARTYIKSRLVMARDIAIIVGGGILGSAGFLLGPFVGIGTIVAGVAGGGAAVAGIHKVTRK